MEWLKEIASYLKSTFLSGNWLNIADKKKLVLFILLAFSVWLLNELSETYTYEIPIAVSYTNFPADKIVTKPLHEELLMVVKAEGFALLTNVMGFSKEKITIDYLKYIQASSINTLSLLNQIDEQLPHEVLDIKPDTLYFHLDSKTEKKLPINLQHKLSFSSQYDLIGSISLTPDSVLVSGPTSILDTLTSLNTETLLLSNISKSQKGKINIVRPNFHNLSLEGQRVDYAFEVEEFTEKELEIPISIANLKTGTEIILIPQTAKIKYQVGFSKYDLIDEQYFKIEADFAEVDLSESNKVILKLVESPPSVKNIQFSPSFVDYLIYQ